MGLLKEIIPTAKFNRVGDKVSGVIVGFTEQHRTEYVPDSPGAGAPMYWHNNKPTAGVATDPQTGQANRPVMDPVVILDTGVDDGYGETQRRLFVKGKQMLNGIKDACKAVGVRDVDEGGRLTCTWVSGLGRTGSPRVYAFEYAPPTPGQAATPPAAPASPAPAQRTVAESVLGTAQPVGAGATPPF